MSEPATFEIKQGYYIQVNGLSMYYESSGDGIPVILLHGGLSTSQMWVPVIPSFSRDYRVITPDTRAHGRTDNPSGLLSFPLMAEDTAQFIQALGLQKPLVVGYSNGGQTALHMAMTYPGLVRGYMIGGIFNSMTTAWLQVMQGQLGIEGPGVVDVERVIQQNPAVIRDLQQQHDVFHTPGYWKTLLVQASRCWWNPPEHTQVDFDKILDPILFWCGDQDVFCPPEQSLEMSRRVKNAELAVIPNADHFTMIQHIDIVILILLSFMKRVIGTN